MNNNLQDKDHKPKRNTSRSKKIIIIVAAVVAVSLAVLAVLSALLPELLDSLDRENYDSSFEDWRFFEADYSKNIYEDELYMSHSRNIRFKDENTEYVLTAENAESISSSAAFFYDYINCIIEGDYENYPSYFTEEYINGNDSLIPEKFTMQGLYDIHISLFAPASVKEVGGVETAYEVYEVSYRIYENNGTFRSDILPDETRTIVFEIYYTNTDSPKINSIGYRTDAE